MQAGLRPGGEGFRITRISVGGWARAASDNPRITAASFRLAAPDMAIYYYDANQVKIAQGISLVMYTLPRVNCFAIIGKMHWDQRAEGDLPARLDTRLQALETRLPTERDAYQPLLAKVSKPAPPALDSDVVSPHHPPVPH